MEGQTCLGKSDFGCSARGHALHNDMSKPEQYPDYWTICIIHIFEEPEEQLVSLEFIQYIILNIPSING